MGNHAAKFQPGADWCDACAKARFKRRYKLGGGVLGERTVPEPYP